MIEFYKVTMQRKHIVTVYKGNTAETTTHLIEETYGSLPYSTAMTYKNKFPDACVRVERDFSHEYDRSRSKPRVQFDDTKSAPRSSKPKQKAVKAPEAEAPVNDYADIVNSMIQKEASA